MIDKYSLGLLNRHWAVQAYKPKPGSKIENIARRAFAYEIAALDIIDAIGPAKSSSQNETFKRYDLRVQAKTAAYLAYLLSLRLPPPEEPENQMIHTLKQAAMACCGGEWNWRERNFDAPSKVNWDKWMLHQLYISWSLVLKLKEPSRIRKIISELRKEQQDYEIILLADVMTMRLLALYHWAIATELLIKYLSEGNPQSLEAEIINHFEKGRKAAPSLELQELLHWLEVTVKLCFFRWV